MTSVTTIAKTTMAKTTSTKTTTTKTTIAKRTTTQTTRQAFGLLKMVKIKINTTTKMYKFSSKDC